jgi:predicted GNAT family N-acyltransferase
VVANAVPCQISLRVGEAYMGSPLARPMDFEQTVPRICNRKSFVVKELTTVAEVRSAHRLRYDVFKTLGYINGSTASCLEVDAYDEYAISFGAVDLSSGEVVATLRLITNRAQSRSKELLQRILWLESDVNLSKKLECVPVSPMPSLFAPAICALVEQYKEGDREIEELSRAVVKPEFRRYGLSRALMEFGLAYATLCGFPILVGGCIPEHVPMYVKYGYQELLGVGLIRYPNVGMMANTVVCDTKRLPAVILSEVTKIQRALIFGDRGYGWENCVFEVTETDRGRWRLFEQPDVAWFSGAGHAYLPML